MQISVLATQWGKSWLNIRSRQLRFMTNRLITLEMLKETHMPPSVRVLTLVDLLLLAQQAGRQTKISTSFWKP
jgi:hypothetical protein